jgi:excisionase family DNA binding protein
MIETSATNNVGQSRGAIEPMLTRSQVARILGVSPTTVTRWAREGRLACHMTLGGHHRFSPTLIEDIRSQMSKQAGS